MGKWTLFFELFDLINLYIFKHLSLHIHFRAFKPSYTFSWVRRVLPETKFKNKWTLFFELFDLSDLYIFEHLSLHIHFQAFKPSYTFSWVGRVLPEAKFENRWTLFFELFLFDRPLLTRDWKSESVTNQLTNLLTWVGARDTCVSKNNNSMSWDVSVL